MPVRASACQWSLTEARLCRATVSSPCGNSGAVAQGAMRGCVCACGGKAWACTDIVVAQDTILGVHKGPVHCIAFDPNFGPKGLLFTGSADRTIKVWDPYVREMKDACIQSIVGHGGTVNAIACGTDCIVSCSNDNTIKVWRPDRDRRILLYPWFLLTQTIKDTSSVAFSV